jgi:hypothetical protein
MRIEQNDHLTELIVEEVDAADMQPRHCLECGGTGSHDKLLQFFTQRGRQSRQHDGAFCSKDCHDRYHGLRPQRKTG